MHIVTEFTKNLIPASWKPTGSGWTSGNCPMCITNGQGRPDTKKRGGFYFEEDKFQYNCFNCGYKTGWSTGKQLSGRLKRLYSVLGADESDIHRLQIELMRERDTAELFIQTVKQDQPVQIDWPTMALPQDSNPVKNYPIHELDEKSVQRFVGACEFLVERGLDNWTDWHYSTFSHFRKRVILPFRCKGNTVGYTARWIGNVPNKETPKYHVQQPKDFVFGLDRQRDKRITIVTEGQLDAVAIDGVAIGSNNMSMEQSKIIELSGNRNILLPDADKAGMKLVRQAIKRGWEVSFPPWDEDVKDANDAVQKYGKLFTIKSILDFSIGNPTKAEIMGKTYCK